MLAVIVVLLGLWELYRWSWTSTGWTWPFIVNDTSMPHVWTIAKAFGQPAQVNQPALITVLLAHSRLLQRGFLPYIVASQTVPILAIAPMVVVWVNPKLPGPLQG